VLSAGDGGRVINDDPAPHYGHLVLVALCPAPADVIRRSASGPSEG
jgi:hypothetical protein